MEAAMEQCSVDRKCCEIQQKQFLIENDRLLDKIISQEIMNIVLNSYAIICDSEKKNEDSVDACNKCRELEAEFLQANDTVISKRKETIHSLRENVNPAKVKKDIDEMKQQTLNWSISMENADLKTQIQEKVFANATFKNELRKLKGKNVIHLAVSKPYATTIALGMFKLNLEPLALKVLKNKDAHLEYIKHSRELADTFWEIVKSARALTPLDSNLDSALIGYTAASKSKPTGNTKNNKISQSSSSNKTNKVEDQSRSVKSRKNKKNRVAKTECNAYVMQYLLTVNSKSVCAICNECLFDADHDKCVIDYVHDVNLLSKSKPTKRKNKKQIWKTTGKVYTKIGYKWKPTGRTFTIVGNKCPLTSIRPKAPKSIGSSSKSKIIKSRISNQSKPTQTGESTVSNVPSSSLIDCRVYYVEGLGHNLFSVGQFYDSKLKVAFHKHTCFVRNLKGVDLLIGSRGTNLYTLSIGDMMKSSPIYLLSKASKTKSWLWHRCLSHLNFGTINQLAKQGLVRGLPKMKFERSLVFCVFVGKSKKQSHKPKFKDTNQEKLYLLHIDLCGPMCVESINGKKYILVIINDYSQFTWVKFLRSKDEALEFILNFLKMIQVRLNATIRNIHTYNRT
ncbi:retrovirus-related pol polyprotein from transposon TNT 1-94 [Tanacetum coccineum]